MLMSLFRNLSGDVAQAAFFRSQRVLMNFLQGLQIEMFKFKGGGARHQSRVNIEKGVLRGESDEGQVSTFHIREESVLLRSVEMVNFVDNKKRSLIVQFPSFDGPLDHVAKLSHTGGHC